MVVNFITLKWGKKYGPEYVNRLFKTLKSIYSGKFSFYCFTDDTRDIHSDVIVKNIDILRPQKNNCFTVEKIFLFDNKIKGNNVLLDLDILIQKDLFPYLKEYNFSQGRFIKNGWIDPLYCEISAKYGTNYINSSFVTWKDNQLQHILNFYIKHRKLIEYKYEDLDTFLFHTLREKLHYHPSNMIMSYNVNTLQSYFKDHSIILFNTSHGKNRGQELHQAKSWVIERWKQYD